ncbi:hypothetical protein [Allokutzneria sp. NRRL B-24872]|uniref:hypothetical protein n=1 Tax=Allokutzneria sp. NRRL B-24872 TaxID=1137961 RepID=UPI001178C223|nr:hypothetical protein [Allokutzneria sp. NRRL B-24872]
MAPTEKEVVKALTLMKLRGTGKDPVTRLVAYSLYCKLPEDVRAVAEQRMVDDPDVLDNLIIRHSRRFDIAVQDRLVRGAEAEARPSLVVKVAVAGSGYDVWATQKDLAPGREVKWERVDELENESGTVHYRRKAEESPDVMFAGTGAPRTEGRLKFGGVRDAGSNSISKLVEEAPGIVKKAIDEALGGDGDRHIFILVKAHSRGAVAASKIALELRSMYADRATLELVAVDPVPGPLHRGRNVKIDLLGEIDEFTLIYSVASGHAAGFTPQQVLGAKRIIISRQNHSVGLLRGFRYGNEIFKGSGINGLPEGVYVDSSGVGEEPEPLSRVADMADATQRIKVEFEKSDAPVRDSDRKDIIRKVLTEYFERQQGWVRRRRP